MTIENHESEFMKHDDGSSAPVSHRHHPAVMAAATRINDIPLAHKCPEYIADIIERDTGYAQMRREIKKLMSIWNEPFPVYWSNLAYERMKRQFERVQDALERGL